ncbi:hypothetical protein [Caulobacter endophyticus]|nr:hypothetical protein [Caulobacter endophyticus]
MEDTYTFIGAMKDGSTVFMDIAALNSETLARQHCHALLHEHDSGDLVELWRGAALIAKIDREVLSGQGPAAISG